MSSLETFRDFIEVFEVLNSGAETGGAIESPRRVVSDRTHDRSGIAAGDDAIPSGARSTGGKTTTDARLKGLTGG